MNVKSFPPFRLDTLNHCLWRSDPNGDESSIALTPKCYALLCYFLENPERLVTQEELLENLWANVFVQPEALKGHIRALRAALGDDASNPSFVQTVRGHGYRFIAKLAPPQGPAIGRGGHADQANFVGRAIPLAELSNDFERACLGGLRMVFVTGEPGIGKTALIREFRRRNASTANVWSATGQCIEGFGGTEAYYPVLEALSNLCKDRDGNGVIQQVVAMAPTWGVSLTGQISAERRQLLQRQIVGAGRNRMLREGCELLEALAAIKPLLLVLEDVHWADCSTVDLLAALARRNSSARLMVIVTTRTEEIALGRHPLRSLFRELNAHGLCREVALDRFDLDATARLIADPGSDADLTLAQWLHDQSRGNALYTVALVDHLVERGFVKRFATRWQILERLDNIPFEVPPTIEQLVEVGIERLQTPRCQALEAASIGGVSFTTRTVAPAAGLEAPAFEEICQELARTETFIHRDAADGDGKLLGGSFTFRHSIHRQIFYDRQGPLRRALSHEKIALQLETIYADRLGEIAPKIEEHFTRAGVWTKAIVYNRLSLMSARQRFAYQDALAIFARSKRLIEHLPAADRVRVEIEFLEMEAATSAALHDPRAGEIYREMARTAAAAALVDVHARALLGLAYTASWQDSKLSVELLDQALALSARQTDAQLQARTRIGSHVWRIWARGWDEVDMQLCEKAVATLNAGESALAAAWPMLEYAQLQFVSSRYREARLTIENNFRLLYAAVDTHPELNMARAIWLYHGVSPCISIMLGEFGTAIQQFDSGIEMFAKNGNDYGFRTLQLFRAWFLVQALDYEHALEALRSISPSSAHPAEHRLQLLLIGVAQAGLGETAQATASLLNVEHMMDSRPATLDWYWRLTLEWTLVNLALMSGDLHEAQRRSDRLIEGAFRTAERTWQALAWETKARVRLTSGDAIEPKRCLDCAQQVILGVEAPLVQWRIHATSVAVIEKQGAPAEINHYAESAHASRQHLLDSLPAAHWLRVSLVRPSLLEPLLNVTWAGRPAA
jgi:DNA-binding winged helix-turn-helix (wHTH) protein